MPLLTPYHSVSFHCPWCGQLWSVEVDGDPDLEKDPPELFQQAMCPMCDHAGVATGSGPERPWEVR